jgi:diketogulonate reductase-like aldo/keto reductase
MWVRRALSGPFRRSSARAGTPHCPPPALSEPAVVAAAGRHGVSPAQVALRWIVQQPAKHVLTVQSHDLGYDKEDLDLWSFALSADEMKQLDAAQL